MYSKIEKMKIENRLNFGKEKKYSFEKYLKILGQKTINYFLKLEA